jgi:hypothetical protein
MGVVTHVGRFADSGHYIGWARQSGDNWLKFDDAVVTPVTTDDIKAIATASRMRHIYRASLLMRCISIPTKFVFVFVFVFSVSYGCVNDIPIADTHMAYLCIYRRVDDVKGRAEALNLPAMVPLVAAPPSNTPAKAAATSSSS